MSFEHIHKNDNKIELHRREEATQADAIISIPIYYNELTNGNLFRLIGGFFRQKLDNNCSIDIVLTLNRGKNKQTKEIVEKTDEIRRILNKIIEVQSIQHKINTLRSEENSQIVEILENQLSLEISTENDENIGEILLAAIKRADDINISYIDISKVDNEKFEELGYPEGHRVIRALRTFGLDYAKKYSKNDSIFLTYDADTYFSSNLAIRELIRYFKENPDAEFLIGNFGLQLAGDNPGLFQTSVYHAIALNNAYSIYDRNNTVQFVIRRSTLDKFKFIRPMPESGSQVISQECEDYALGQLLYLVFHAVQSIPLPYFINLTTNRSDGNWDGAVSREVFTRSTIYEALDRIDEIIKEIKKLPHEEIEAIGQDYLLAIKKFDKEVRKIRLLYRIGALEFVELLDQGKISIDQNNHCLHIDKSAIKSKFLLRYLEQNESFVSTLTDNDIKWLKYCLGKTMYHPDESTITKTQEAIINYFGKYQSFEEIRNDAHHNDIMYSIYYGLWVGILVYGEIYRKYFARNDLLKQLKIFYPSMIPNDVLAQYNNTEFAGDRTEWLD